MKALLLTGGRGTRLRPLTHTKNKHLLPIANQPLILYPFGNIIDAGIKEIGIIVNETGPEIKELLGDGSKWGVKIDYIFQDHPGGLAHALSLGKEYIGDSKFVMVLGDNMLQNHLGAYRKKFEDSGFEGFLLGRKVPLKDHKRFGMATLDSNNQVLRYIEKPGVVDKSPIYNPEMSVGVAGFYFFDPVVFNCFEGVDAITESARGELEIAAPFNWLIEHGYKVGISEVDGWWNDPGNPNDMFDTNKLILTWKKDFKNEAEVINSKIDENVSIGKGSKVENSTIKGPAVIGENVQIKDCEIGAYTSIADQCNLKNIKIENSILLTNVRAEKVPITLEGCLIGYNSEILSENETPSKTSLLIGDDSRVVF